MSWKKNKRLVREGFMDLAYLPRGRSDWDATLASAAFAARRDLTHAPPDLNAWAARHGVAASARFAELGPDSTVLWHGTSRERAERIAEHGLFHFRGLWTTFNPYVAHSYCRGRSARFGVDGAMVCLVLDESEIEAGVHYDSESDDEVRRFHGPLPPDAVEFILTPDGIDFVGAERLRRPPAWRSAAFRRRDGRWAPKQSAPVRFSDSETYSTVDEFARLTVLRLLHQLGNVAAVEVFSSLYALIAPREALTHAQVFDLIEALCGVHHHHQTSVLRLRAGGPS